ncbi:hypothetical protein [Nostoc favosum]|uniref:DUF5648 domain-containing protein n=1 Tax=Nostoc favosum CHAB5714 TaxID=2780399 RepID=A0ABS8IAF5_9NOSO|nr:hypothetical protein [Nostoc favosum]MCC5601121.1 hypothetical protein [Nostoc favosum CHAB5714]
MFGNWSWRRVLKTFGGLAVGIASISTVNYLTTNHLALATSNSSQLQNSNQLSISKGKSSPENILVAQNPVLSSPITRTINGAEVTAYAFYRYYNPSIGDHFYTVNFAELGNGNGGYISEGIAAYISTQQDPGTIPLYRAYSGSATDHFYTTNLSELVAAGGSSGYVYEGVAGYIYSMPFTGTTPLYRYYSSGGTDHFYTTNFGELGGGRNGYVFEGIVGYVIPN